MQEEMVLQAKHAQEIGAVLDVKNAEVITLNEQLKALRLEAAAATREAASATSALLEAQGLGNKDEGDAERVSEELKQAQAINGQLKSDCERLELECREKWFEHESLKAKFEELTTDKQRLELEKETNGRKARGEVAMAVAMYRALQPNPVISVAALAIAAMRANAEAGVATARESAAVKRAEAAEECNFDLEARSLRQVVSAGVVIEERKIFVCGRRHCGKVSRRAYKESSSMPSRPLSRQRRRLRCDSSHLIEWG